MSRPELAAVLEEIELFERERTDRQSVEVAILLYNHGVSLCKVKRVLGWLGVERSHVAVWTWIQTFGQKLPAAGRRPVADLPSIILMDETAISQQGEEFTVFAGVDPETPHLLHAAVASSRTTLTTRWFLSDLAELYGRAPPIVVTDGATYGPVFRPLGVTSPTAQRTNPYRTLDPRAKTPHQHVLRLLYWDVLTTTG